MSTSLTVAQRFPTAATGDAPGSNRYPVAAQIAAGRYHDRSGSVFAEKTY